MPGCVKLASRGPGRRLSPEGSERDHEPWLAMSRMRRVVLAVRVEVLDVWAEDLHDGHDCANVSVRSPVGAMPPRPHGVPADSARGDSLGRPRGRSAMSATLVALV